MEPPAKLESSKISFVLNGKQVQVVNPDPAETLLSFLRRTARLKGTKSMCLQGGCGACTVTLSIPESSNPPPPRGGTRHVAVNACLRPLCSVDGMEVRSVEGVGSVEGGLHEIQQSMHDNNASQCGFCTPGFVMSMYSLAQQKGELTPLDVERVADGNICRCTGYRPILDAFQAVACGGCKSTKGGVPPQGPPPSCGPEIEDLCASSSRCIKLAANQTLPSKEASRKLPAGCKSDRLVVHEKDGVTWRTVLSLEDLFSTMSEGGKSVRLVCGNTSSGVYPPRPASTLVDISRVPELRSVKVTPRGITIGGAVTISEFMAMLGEREGEAANYGPLLKHLRRVANTQVRNVGSVVGNLMMTRQHPEFPSDVATILVACGASLAVAVTVPSERGAGSVVKVDLLSFLRREGSPAGVNSDESVIVLSVHIPAISASTHKFLTYKVAQRAVNSHAYVNAAFVFSCDRETGVNSAPPVLVFGGLRPLPCRAPLSEAFLTGKSALDDDVITHTLSLLSAELAPDPSEKKAAFRGKVAGSFLYKGLLSTVPVGKLPGDLMSVVTPFERPVSTGQVSFDQGDPSEYPVSKPIPKLSEAIQTTGEARYLDDVDHAGELHAAFVKSTVAIASIAEIDASDALALEGVEKFVSAETLRAEGLGNRVSPWEELFAEEKIIFHGQPVGIVIASSPELAQKAASLVRVSYADVAPPLLSLDDAVKHNSFFEDKGCALKAGSFQEAAANSDAVVSGTSAVSHQYHFTMETQRSVTIPGEDGSLIVHSSTQSPSLTQQAVSQLTGVPMHKIKVIVRRLGGGYGGKASRSVPVALASVIGCILTQRPVRIVLDLPSNMQMVGGRSPYRFEYSVAVKKDGEITGVKMHVLNNHGSHLDMMYPIMMGFLLNVDNVYNIKNWDVDVQVAKTNLPSSTFMRAPGNVEALFAMETMIGHVAASLGLPACHVRERNLYRTGDVTVWGARLDYCNAGLVIDTLKASADFNRRSELVEEFNRGSRWVKRGIALAPLKYCISWGFAKFNTFVNIFPDGTVSVQHSGVEMGQGMNVKVAQVTSLSLGVLTSDGCPIEKICVRETSTDVSNNTSPTGASIGSELNCKATKGACDILVERLRPLAIQLRMRNRGVAATWQELIGQAVSEGADLQARFHLKPGESEKGLLQYMSFGAGVSEVEVDLLTGESRILRSDLLMDCGKSLNPAVDIGQVQGAFVMGLGYLLTEELEYDKETGKLLTDSTWEYKPPSFADIPIDLRAGLVQNSDNPYGFMGSKASGEPPLAMACSALFAVQNALCAGKKEIIRRMKSFNRESNRNSECSFWVSLPAPASVERVCLLADVPLALCTL